MLSEYANCLMKEACPLCAEINGNPEYDQYKQVAPSNLPNRILYSSDNFIVIPALCPLHERHLLLLTRDHFLNFSQIPPASFAEFSLLFSFLKKILTTSYERPIIFEHGPLSEKRNAGSCITHAHIHILPLKNDIEPQLSTDFKKNEAQGVGEITIQEQKIPYIFYQNQNGDSFIYEVNDNLPSQYIRQLIAESIGKPDIWDWSQHLGINILLKTYTKLVNKLSPLNKAYLINKYFDIVNRDAYNLSADDFAQTTGNIRKPGNVLSQEIDRAISYVNRNAYVLDVGCGVGYDLREFKEKGCNVVGLDISEKMLILSKKYTSDVIPLILATSINLPFNNSYFDIVWCVATFHHFPKEIAFNVFAELFRCVKKSGIISICTYDGFGEEIAIDKRYNWVEKFYSYYEMEELIEWACKLGGEVLSTHKYQSKVGQPGSEKTKRSKIWLHVRKH